MKNIVLSFHRRVVVALSVFLFGTMSCTDLDVPIKSEYTSENFPKTSEQYIAATGPIYVQLRDQMARSYWFLQELTTDEAVITARNGNWYDGGTYMQLNVHTWSAQHGFVAGTWQWGFSGITTCNRVLSLIESTETSAAKLRTIAEIKTMRALYYFLMMDLYGNIPIVPAFGSTDQPVNSKRATVFTYIENELIQALPDLLEEVSQATYGRPTKSLAQAMLAKMYLNAEVYTGTQQYTKAVAACNTIIQSKKHSLYGNYMGIFDSKNGPQISEIIFAVPYDGNLATGQYFARYALHPALKDKYTIPFTPSNASSTWPEFYALYNEVTDSRNQQWLAGKQYLSDGKTPILIATTKKGVDASYSGADGSAKVNYHLEFTGPLTFTDQSKFEVGGDELGKAKGIRNIKYFPDNTVPVRDQGNDFVLFRYADVLLMKAEAMLRGGVDTELGEDPTNLVNQIRSRAGVSAFSTLDLPTLFEERSREMAWEGWRRNDLIRFGKWESTWGIKTNVDTYRRIFPIPTNEISLNPKLIQNEGYN